jgi:hypothetical protein
MSNDTSEYENHNELNNNNDISKIVVRSFSNHLQLKKSVFTFSIHFKNLIHPKV